MEQSPCNGQWWGNQVRPVILVFFDCCTNSGRRCCSGSYDDPTDFQHIFFDKNSPLVQRVERKDGGDVFDVLAELLLHRERAKAYSGRAWSSLRPVLHQTLVKHQADRQLSGSDRSDHRHGYARLIYPATALPLLSIIPLRLAKRQTEGSEAYGRHFLVVFRCVWLQCNFNGHFRVSPRRREVCVLQKAAASVGDAAGEGEKESNQRET